MMLSSWCINIFYIMNNNITHDNWTCVLYDWLLVYYNHFYKKKITLKFQQNSIGVILYEMTVMIYFNKSLHDVNINV